MFDAGIAGRDNTVNLIVLFLDYVQGVHQWLLLSNMIYFSHE